jgi:hypothetical protein
LWILHLSSVTEDACSWTEDKNAFIYKSIRGMHILGQVICYFKELLPWQRHVFMRTFRTIMPCIHFEVVYSSLPKTWRLLIN